MFVVLPCFFVENEHRKEDIMEILDYLLTGAIVVVALWYLYRKIVVNKGCGCGASSCGSGNSQSQKPKERNEQGE